MEVATNLDMSAECRAGPREPLRPKASDFVGEEVHPPAPGVAGHVEAELQVPAGPLNPAGDAEEARMLGRMKRSQALFPLTDRELNHA